MIGSSTRIVSEIARDDSDNTPKLPIRTVSGKRYPEVDQSAIIDCTAHRPQQPHPHTSTRHMSLPLCAHPSSSQTSQHLIRKDRYTAANFLLSTSLILHLHTSHRYVSRLRLTPHKIRLRPRMFLCRQLVISFQPICNDEHATEPAPVCPDEIPGLVGRIKPQKWGQKPLLFKPE